MKKIELDIIAISPGASRTQSYAVILSESEGIRRLPVLIGPFEAQAILVAIENMQPQRPLTHDLLKNVFDSFAIELREIVISNLRNGIFYARLICDRDGETLEIDSRTSDALALAVRFKCPIYAYDFILEEAGIILEEDMGEGSSGAISPKRKNVKQPETAKAPASDNISAQSTEKLNTLLEEALADEDYERAAQIRDELNKRA